ncbi:g12921 [Coccomyxa viridis]|uniref:G12921 protein n=1 Tax=Coccomyxa viridis TaxID=1274662 RepID=A0ABP1GCK9_9CHLO
MVRAIDADEIIAEAMGEEDDEPEFEDEDDGSGLSTQQVHTLLHVMCQETEIAEVELQMGSFEMRVRRSSKGSNGASNMSMYSNGSEPAYPTPPPGSAFASTASMDIPAGDMPQQSMSQSSLDSDDFDDESTVFLTAPKVGLMRRARYVKGKKVGKGNMVNDGDEVKAGQVLGFIEQLGTFMPVEAPQAGEIVSFAVEEGQPVEYNQPIVELAPFFGGHIIGDRKHV